MERSDCDSLLSLSSTQQQEGTSLLVILQLSLYPYMEFLNTPINIVKIFGKKKKTAYYNMYNVTQDNNGEDMVITVPSGHCPPAYTQHFCSMVQYSD